jgi:hypothetical protein
VAGAVVAWLTGVGEAKTDVRSRATLVGRNGYSLVAGAAGEVVGAAAG